MKYNFSLKNRIAFYWSYFLSKVFLIWFEVKRPKFIMFGYEMLYSLRKFSDPKYMLPSPFGTDEVKTIFGRFAIRPHTVDMSTVSPAFERTDLSHLLDLLETLKREGKKILFLDIGAYIGTYSITVGNRFRKYGDLHIIAFEPSGSNYEILEKNVTMNELRNTIETKNIALYHEDGIRLGFQSSPEAAVASRISPATQGKNITAVTTTTLNTLMEEKASAYDAIIMKIDVEGVETEVLQGGDRLLRSDAEVYVVAEDFTDSRIVSFLEKSGATFITKVSPYNSWWKW
jgi:FkbM family methyltransferase